MPDTRYICFYVTNGGVPAASLNPLPVVASLRTSDSSNTNLLSGQTAPTLTNVGNGWYRLQIDHGGVFWPLNKDVIGTVNADPGGSTLGQSDRYIPFMLSRSEPLEVASTLLATTVKTTPTPPTVPASTRDIENILARLLDETVSRTKWTWLKDSANGNANVFFPQVDARYANGHPDSLDSGSGGAYTSGVLLAGKDIAKSLLETRLNDTTAFTVAVPTTNDQTMDHPSYQLGWILKNIRWKIDPADAYKDSYWPKITLDDMKGFCRTNMSNSNYTDSTSAPQDETQIGNTLKALAKFNWAVWSGSSNPAYLKVNVKELDTAVRDNVVDAVWDEFLTGHGLTGSAGQVLASFTTSNIASAVWNAAIATYNAAGSFGNYLQSLTTAAFANAVFDTSLTSGHNTTGSLAAMLKNVNAKTDPLLYDVSNYVRASVVGTVTIDTTNMARDFWKYNLTDNFSADSTTLGDVSKSTGRALYKVQDKIAKFAYKDVAGTWYMKVTLEDGVHGYLEGSALPAGLEQLARAVHVREGHQETLVASASSTTVFQTNTVLADCAGSMLVFTDPTKQMFGVSRRVASVVSYTVTLEDPLPSLPVAGQRVTVIPDKGATMEIPPTLKTEIAKAVLEEALSAGSPAHDTVSGSLAQAVRVCLQVLAGKQVQRLNDGRIVVMAADGSTPLRTFTFAEDSVNGQMERTVS